MGSEMCIRDSNMVVNGSVSFVGSSRRTAQEAVAAALKAPVPVDVSAEVESWEQGAVEVAWAVEGGATCLLYTSDAADE